MNLIVMHLHMKGITMLLMMIKNYFKKKYKNIKPDEGLMHHIGVSVLKPELIMILCKGGNAYVLCKNVEICLKQV